MADALPSQEKLLQDYVQRLEKHRRGRGVVVLHLSDLRPVNRREQHLRAATSNFDPLVSNMAGQLFQLKNGDLFFGFKLDVKPQVETIVQKIRFLFSEDPLVEGESKPGALPFASWFDADADYEEIVKLVQHVAEVEQRRHSEVRNRMDARQRLKEKQQRGEPLTPDVLARVEEALVRADLSNLVRRQYVCRIDSQMVPEQAFSELFISIKDLRETVLPGVNLTANRWLFNHLTETLDKRVLSMLMKTDALTISGEISFNSNVKTLLSPQFQNFDDNITASRRGAIIIELQKEDIFADLSTYMFAREFVQEKGYRVLLDGLTVSTMRMIDRERLGCDMAKLIWHPDLVDGGEETVQFLKNMLKRGGPDRLVLCRCDNREAVDFGRSVGIELFQGRYIETLIAEDNRRRELLRLKRRIERSSQPAEEEEE